MCVFFGFFLASYPYCVLDAAIWPFSHGQGKEGTVLKRLCFQASFVFVKAVTIVFVEKPLLEV